MGKVLVGIGVFILQDALASIAYYPSEKWRWNHIARLARVVCGIILIVMGILI